MNPYRTSTALVVQQSLPPLGPRPSCECGVCEDGVSVFAAVGGPLHNRACDAWRELWWQHEQLRCSRRWWRRAGRLCKWMLNHVAMWHCMR